jgi:predicted membrane protein
LQHFSFKLLLFYQYSRKTLDSVVLFNRTFLMSKIVLIIFNQFDICVCKVTWMYE